MRCSTCGHENAGQARHCGNCGALLGDEPPPDAEQAQLQALIDAGQFAAVLKAIPEQAPAQLLDLRAQAQSRFAATAEQMVALYESRFGLLEWNERRARPALRSFREQTPAGKAIDLVDEAAAYADALLREARSLMAQGEFDRARVRMNTLQVLPGQREAHSQSIHAILLAMPPAPPDAPALTRRLDLQVEAASASANGASAAEPAPTADSHSVTRRLDPQDETAPKQRDRHTTGTGSLTPAEATEDESRAHAIAAFDALEVQISRQADLPLEMLARPAAKRSGWADLEAALEHARSQVPADPSLAQRLDFADRRRALLRDDTPTLLAALDAPLATWLGDQVPGQITGSLKAHGRKAEEILKKIEDGFGPEVAPAPALRAYYTRRQSEVRAVKTQIENLRALDGAALETQVNELKGLGLPEDVFLAAQQRLDAYQTQLRESQEEATARKALDELIERHREKRYELDRLFEDATPSAERFITLRDEASGFTNHPLLTSDNNPLDPATFAYYDLIFASRYRTLTAPSTEAQLAQTVLGAGDYLNAYQRLVNEAMRLEGGDDRLAYETTVKLRENALVALRNHVEETIREALKSAKDHLDHYDFQAAEETLLIARKKKTDAAIPIDSGLLSSLTQILEEVEKQASRDRAAHELIERADQLTRPEIASPDYPRALEALDNAAQTAAWLKESIERQREQVGQRRTAFVTARLQLADGQIRAGTLATFDKARENLDSAELNADTKEQQQQINLLRARIAERQQALAQLDALRKTILSYVEDAREGTNLDLLPGRIAQARIRIGTQEVPHFEEGIWVELDRLLTSAEDRLAARKTFNGMVARAEGAALLGQEREFEDLLTQIKEFTGQYTFLKLDTAEDLRRQARQSSRLERARQFLYNIRRRMEDRDQTLTADDISSVIQNTESYESDDEVREDRTFLIRMLPLYRDYDLLKRAMAALNFDEFDRVYTGLTTDIQSDPRISRLKQDAEIARGAVRIQKGFDALQREAEDLFREGWDQPDRLAEFMQRLRAFAEPIPSEQRNGMPGLEVTVVTALNRLAQTVADARGNYVHQHYPAALRQVRSALKLIPSHSTEGKDLDIYASTLTSLREILLDVEQEISTEIGTEDDQNKVTAVIGTYNSTVSSPKSAFATAELTKVRNTFTELVLSSRQIQEKRNGYTIILKRIVDLIDRADALEDLIIIGHRPGDEAPANQSGPARLALVEQEIKALLTESEDIRATHEGAAWLGIRVYECFKALYDLRSLAHTLAEGKLWLESSRNPQQQTPELRRLLSEVEPFQKKLDFRPNNTEGSAIKDLLEKSTCTAALLSGCMILYREIAQRKGKIEAEIKRREGKQRSWVGTILAMAALAILGLVGWNVPFVHDQAVTLMVGTLTPVPDLTGTALATGSGVIVVTATPAPTVTPIPTPTPIPPQAGVVTVPGNGQLNVRARPNSSLNRINIVRTGDEVLVTGFCDAPDGTRWYRVDVPSRFLSGVWLVAEVTVGNQAGPSVHFDGGAQVNPALQVPYQP